MIYGNTIYMYSIYLSTSDLLSCIISNTDKYEFSSIWKWISNFNDVMNHIDCVKKRDVYPQKMHSCSKNIHCISEKKKKNIIGGIAWTFAYLKDNTLLNPSHSCWYHSTLFTTLIFVYITQPSLPPPFFLTSPNPSYHPQSDINYSVLLTHDTGLLHNAQSSISLQFWATSLNPVFVKRI